MAKYVHCGCDHHGDHGGCDADCREYEGCQGPPVIDSLIFQRLEELGIDFERLDKCLGGRDNWGEMVHAFEYLTVLGTVRDTWKKHQ